MLKIITSETKMIKSIINMMKSFMVGDELELITAPSYIEIYKLSACSSCALTVKIPKSSFLEYEPTTDRIILPATTLQKIFLNLPDKNAKLTMEIMKDERLLVTIKTPSKETTYKTPTIEPEVAMSTERTRIDAWDSSVNINIIQLIDMINDNIPDSEESLILTCNPKSFHISSVKTLVKIKSQLSLGSYVQVVCKEKQIGIFNSSFLKTIDFFKNFSDKVKLNITTDVPLMAEVKTDKIHIEYFIAPRTDISATDLEEPDVNSDKNNTA